MLAESHGGVDNGRGDFRNVQYGTYQAWRLIGSIDLKF